MGHTNTDDCMPRPRERAGMGAARLVLALIAAAGAPGAAAVSMKSVQVWSGRVADPQPGERQWGSPQVYAYNVGSSGSDSGARAPIGTWTFVGCFQAVGLSSVGAGFTPQTCTKACDAEGRSTAAVQGTECFCLEQGRQQLGSRAEFESHCQAPCPKDYFDGIARQCGGPGGYYSAYQKYSFVHQTAQGCYDPRRFIWYQSVGIEVVEYSEAGLAVGYSIETHLHAASINSGEPLFPYHQALDDLHFGLQYDLDSSRIVAYTLPMWPGKTRFEGWNPSVVTYAVSTLEGNVAFTKAKVPFYFDSADVSEFQLSTGISAIDALHDIYYIAMPTIPQVPGFFDPRFYQTKLYGINLNTFEDVLGGRILDHPVVLLEVNSQSHELFALLKEESASDEEDSKFYYVRLGDSYRSNSTSNTLSVIFEWALSDPLVEHVVNPYSYQKFVDKVYQVGSSAVDHLSNTSFFVMKDSTKADDPIHIVDVNQHGSLRTEGYAPLLTPDVQATWLANTDPIIPLSLAAPKLVSARFTVDGRSILVKFDAFTVEGALPIDSDGDMLPDGIDWSKRQIGMRNCSDMFATATAELLGDMPQTSCEWRSGTAIQIHLSAGFTSVKVGTGLFLKDMTVYAYLAEGSQWSMAASGGISVGPPEPLDPPKMVVKWNKYVDLCSPLTISAMSSYNHGDQPAWVWFLKGVSCVGSIQPNSGSTSEVEELMEAASVGGSIDPESGSYLLEFSKDQLQPGCTYAMALNLTGRWGVTSTADVVVSKQSVPAPKVSMQNAREMITTRGRVLTLQAQVENSECETLSIQNQVLRFLWSGRTEAVNAFSGATEQNPIDDLTLLAPKIASASLMIPKYVLEPDVTYTFTIKVGYAETWSDLGATTSEEVAVFVDRSPIKVNVAGGSRRARKTNLLALDSRTSLDPDFPNDLVESNEAWSFSYECSTPEGQVCFPVSTNAVLPDVRPCELSTETFEDLGEAYDVPSFSTEELRSDSYYCSHPDKRGVLILNMRNEKALSPGSGGEPGNYTFVVIGRANGREASASATIQVMAADVAAPQVIIEPLATAKVVTTQRLKVTGDLTVKDRAQYGDSVVWGWTFFRKETNPKFSQQAAEEAEANGEVYLVPESIYIEAIELEASEGQDIVLTSLTSNSLVLQSSTLRPSTTYAFRLTATTPHPLRADEGLTLEGYGELEIGTAGPPPIPGELLIVPEGESVVDQEKTITAVSWTAMDTPLTYMFSYRSDIKGNFSDPMDLRVNPIGASEQKVWCMRAGLESEDYKVQVFVTVYSLYGASTTFSTEYRVLPPLDLAATNEKIKAKAAEVDPETSTQVLACYQLPSPPSPATPGSPAPPPPSAEEQAALEDAANELIAMLSASSDNAVVTEAAVSANLQAVGSIAASGAVTEEMLDFVAQLTEQVIPLVEAAESDESRDAVASSLFNALGSMGMASAGSSTAVAEARSVNSANPEKGLYFPSSATRPPTESVLQVVAPQHSLGRRLSDAKPNYVIHESSFPQGAGLPDPPAFGPRSYDNASAAYLQELWEDMYDVQEELELAWLAFLAAQKVQASLESLELSRDEEYFANYTAHLGPEEREIVSRAWWEEKARRDALKQADLFKKSTQARQMMEQISKICSALLRYMLNQERKEFIFPMGRIRFGRSRNLTSAEETFSLGDPNWVMSPDQLGSYGWQRTEFTEVNPMSWALNGQMSGPYLVSTLDIYGDDGAHLEVEKQSVPLGIMSDHSSYAAATCRYWDWEANNGLGAWAQDGVLNDENGCSSTHLSIIGMFLDVASPIIELPSAAEAFLGDRVVQQNTFVVIAVGAMLALNGLLHYWGFKQDGSDRTKPVEMKKLGDGIKGPRSQEDPVHYSDYTVPQIIGTIWNLACRDHILVCCFCRCQKMKVTRLQKASILFAAFSGTAAVSALLCGEHVVDPKHYVEVGFIAATVTYPMVGALAILFSSRPLSERGLSRQFGSSNSLECFGPLEALPLPDDELEEEGESLEGPDDVGAGAGVAAAATTPPPPQPPPSSSVAGEPEAGGGPQSAMFLQQTGASSAGSTVPPAPPAPGQAPPAPPPVRVAWGDGPSAALPLGLGPKMRGPPLMRDGLQRPPPPPAGGAAGSQAEPSLPRVPVPPKPPPLPAHKAGPSSSGAPVPPPGTVPGADPAGSPTGGFPGAPPMPPVSAPRGAAGEELALARIDDHGGGVLALLDPPMPEPEASGAAQVALSNTQEQLLRRVRRMYVEKVIQDSERVTYDERVDMKSNASHPLAQLANAMAHLAVASYWIAASALTVAYALYFSPATATRWAYACLSGWAFTWLVLEVVKVALSAILELSELSHRRGVAEHFKIKEKVRLKTERKKRQMEVLGKAAGIVPKMHSLLPRPPMPPEPPPAMANTTSLPALGDASAG